MPRGHYARDDKRSEAWKEEAACANTDTAAIFFPTEERSVPSYCEACPVVAECLMYAIAGAEQGIWGGTTEKKRRLWQRQMKMTREEAFRRLARLDAHRKERAG